MDAAIKKQAVDLAEDCKAKDPRAAQFIEKALHAAYADGLEAIVRDLNERVENCFKILSDGRVVTHTESGEWRARMELLQSLREQIGRQAQTARGESPTQE